MIQDSIIRYSKFLILLISIWSANLSKNPRVSIITSVYNGDQFIENFLADITQQTIFEQCELILINANSPGNEEFVIRLYTRRFPNIIYHKLDKDPGLYGVWNYAIKMSHADYITNANLDDRRNPESLEKQAEALEHNPDIDLVYSSYLITYYPNETYQQNNYRYYVEALEFSKHLMYLCLPGPQPMWRKSLHDKYGYFDEDFTSAGDLEMWNRAVKSGARFKKITGISGLFYMNPMGLSTNNNPERIARRKLEDGIISQKYSSMWNNP